MKRITLLLVVSLVLFSCSEDERKEFEHAGGKITMALDNQPTTYIPQKVGDFYSATVLSQITEGLVGIDPKSLEIVPRIASSWKQSSDGKTFTFYLRKNVKFHKHKALKSEKDRLLTAEDVIRSFEIGCAKDSKGEPLATYSLVCKSLVKGADAFYNGEASSISGIVGKGNKVTFHLTYSDHNFLYKLAQVNSHIISRKVVDGGYAGDVIGTGPFMYKKEKSNSDYKSLLLVRNTDYYLKDDKGNALPYLDELEFVFQSRKMAQLEMFENRSIDLIKGIPTSQITKMMQGRLEDFNGKPPKLILDDNPLLESNYYLFNMQDERFADPKVRMAFNYAINKEIIGSDILRNQINEVGLYGITPPVRRTLKGYDFKGIGESGYDYDPEKARKLLAEAGYPNGEGFGTVRLRYNINDIHSAVADEFSKQIRSVLNINVNIDGSTFEQLISDAETGNGDIFRLGWSADYPSPESFLVNFYGKNIPDNPNEPSKVNKSRYKNPVFDEFYERATGTKKQTDQLKFFAKAEKVLLSDPPLIPLWYSGDYAIIYSDVRNFHFNSLNYLDFTYVYKKKWTKEEFLKKHVGDK
ncbi:MAG: peptide ABC transporter substrate-binding protein [bacterium]|nr:peptide ABC transporter substrate-binding protein [bacterium]